MDAAFAGLLREYRLAAGLTQEALAERAGLGVRSIQALERGASRPLRGTLRRLVDALALDDGERARLLEASPLAARRTSAAPVAHLPAGMAVPAPPRPPSPRHNLPAALAPLVGREAELGEVLALLAEARLVTLTGSGGVGKTRLALAVAEQAAGNYPDGVWLVELAALAEDRLVAQTVLETLGMREEAGRPLLATLAEYLKEKRLLLVLDNCEHLVDACAALTTALLRACPSMRLLTTSREALDVSGEVAWRVPSLRVPDPTQLPPPEITGTYEAVRLFVARARQRRPDFALTDQNVRAAATVCARLDGIPLAIELAAARVGSLGVEGIAARLDDRFHLLTGGGRDVLPRQRTLRAALDWSYDLLTPSEQLLLDRLSVFAGGCTLAAAEAVCAGEGLEGEPRGGSHDAPDVGKWETLDLLASLVHKSLVQAEEVDGEVRYGQLETVRQYGQERLAAAGGLVRLRDRHLAWYLTLAEEAAPHLWGTADQRVWLDRVEAEHDNVRAALRWARERGAAEEGLRLAGSLGSFWLNRGYLGEGRAWLAGALAAGSGAPAAVRAGALVAATGLASWQGAFANAAAQAEESLALYRALGDIHGIAAALRGLAFALEWQCEFARATTIGEEALALSRALGDRPGMADALNRLALVARGRGEYGRATALHEESLVLWRDVGGRGNLAYTLSNLAWVIAWRGAYARAAALAEEALSLFREVGNQAGIGWSQMTLGWSLLSLGEEGRATALIEEAVAPVREAGHFWGVPWSLTWLGWAAYVRGEYERAANLQEQALAHFRQVPYRWGEAWVLAALGCVLQARGEYARAAARLHEGLALAHEIGARGLLVEALEACAWLAAAGGQAARAARLGGAAEALRAALGAALHPILHAGHERAVRAVRDALGEAACAAAWAEGQALSLEQVVALALAGCTELV